MKVIEITSRIFAATEISIVTHYTFPDGRRHQHTLWTGYVNEVPDGLLEKNVFGIEAVDEDRIFIHIF